LISKYLYLNYSSLAYPGISLFMKKSLLTLLVGATVLAGCDPDKENGPSVPSSPGVYILSEGQFGKGDGTVSAFGIASKALLTDAFGTINNGTRLGDVIQDMGIAGSQGYICVNASSKVEVVSIPDFRSIATIKKIPQPRYFAATSATRGYVTAWRGPYTNYEDGKVMVLNLSNNTLIDSIAVGRCPEQLTVANGLLYVPNSYDNTVSVIDPATNKVTKVTVAAGPKTVVADQSGSLWVLCSPPYGTTGTPALVRFAPGSTTAQLTLPFAGGDPSHLRISPDKTQLYYSYGGAEYKLSTMATTLPTTPFIRRDFTGFAIDPRDNTIYAAVSTGFTTNGRFLRYPAAGGAPIDSFTVKVGPNGFVFY
jgi:YVTN family beta-propeller protein